MKEQLRKIVETIKKSTGQTQEEIAVGMGYKKNYISEMLTPTGEVTKKFMTAIKGKYEEILLENRNIRAKSNKSLLTSNTQENLIAVNTAIKILCLKIAELESRLSELEPGTTKKGYAEASLDIERMMQQEQKLTLDELRNE